MVHKYVNVYINRYINCVLYELYLNKVLIKNYWSFPGAETEGGNKHGITVMDGIQYKMGLLRLTSIGLNSN